MASKKPDPFATDEDNPEWTKEDHAKSRAAAEVLAEQGISMPRAVGRPKVANPKEPITIRLEADVVAAWRATGKGWQTRMGEVLAEAAPKKAG